MVMTEIESVLTKRTVGFENVPLFDGIDNVEIWLETFEMFQKVNRWSDDECAAILPLRLSGTARSWFRSRIRADDATTWEALKSALRAQFEVRHSNSSIISLIDRIRQEPTERVLTYRTRFLDLLALLPNPLHEAASVEFFINGLLPPLKEKVVSLAAYPFEMNQVVEVAKRFCPSLQPRAQPHLGDARVVYQATQNRGDSVEELRMMVDDLRNELRNVAVANEERYHVNRVGYQQIDRREFLPPVNRNYQGRNGQGRMRRPLDGCFICRGPHYMSYCPDHENFEKFRKSSKQAGNSPASA